MIAIIDYDAGNIRSVEKAMAKLGTGCLDHQRPGYAFFGCRQGDPAVELDSVWRRYEHIFGSTDLVEVIQERGRRRKSHFLESVWGCSFCLSRSEESPGVEGLGNPQRRKILKIPETGRLKDPAYGLEFPDVYRMRADCIRGIWNKIRMFILYTPII